MRLLFGSLSAVVGSDHGRLRAAKMNTLQLVSQPWLSAGPRCGFAASRPAHLHLPTFRMLPEAVGVQARLSSDGIESKVFGTGRRPSCPKPVCCAAALWSPGLRPGLPTLHMSGQAGFLETRAATAPGKQPAPGLPCCKMPFVTPQAPPSGQRLHQEMLYQMKVQLSSLDFKTPVV